jgi:CheY-like chemotaxis protein/HPt (histidine-containing phosphotransfer) domain-containing protein
MTIGGDTGVLLAALPSPRVLVAEDDPVNQDIALLLLNTLGYEVDVVGTGSEALRAAQGFRYDVVLMDVKMPEMDGLEATRQIRTTISTQQQPPIIAMTASATSGDRQTYLQVGMDDVLPKPIHIETLKNVLNAWVGNGGANRPSTGGIPVGSDVATDGPGTSSTSGAGDIGLPVFDPSVLDALAGELGSAGAAVRKDLIETFLGTSQNRIDAITSASLAMDGEMLASCAHAIKSASGAIGLVALSKVAEKIEADLRALPGQLDVELEAAKLAAEYDRATQALLELSL